MNILKCYTVLITLERHNYKILHWTINLLKTVMLSMKTKNRYIFYTLMNVHKNDNFIWFKFMIVI